jgi:GTP cyclohydrolase I
VNAPEKLPLPDAQSQPDGRELPIDRVGVKGLRYPLSLRTSAGEIQHTVGELAMDVVLAHDAKGAHMSRFLEVLERRRAPLDLAALRELHRDMLKRLGAKRGRIELRFPYFIRKTAPASGVESLLDYDVRFLVENATDGVVRLEVGLTVPVTSLCPSSKSIADYGAHNQRSHITIRAEIAGEIALEELARAAEEEASAEIYGLLKRTDEKLVTERAYDHPKFVEDLVRDVALRLRLDPRIGRFSVAAENFESIHNHSAYAEITGIGAAGDRSVR